MATHGAYVIVGGGLAGAKAAETLRASGFAGPVVLVGTEPDLPYERPPLSKEILRGEAEDSSAFVHPEDYYSEHDIELRLDTLVTSIDTAAGTVSTADGEPVGYERLLIATGAEPRRLDVPGSDLEGIHYLRTLADSQYLRTALRSANRLAVVGAGWIGSEVAASARQLGVDVALVDPMGAPLVRVLGPELGRVYRDLHREHGVSLHMDTAVTGFAGDGRVSGVVTGDGSVIDADLVVVGIGVEPRLDLARAAGLDLEGGIRVDATLETSVPGVFAAGDVAAAWHPVLDRRLRVEHWANALNQGETAGRNMLGQAQPYDRVPYFFSDQYDLGMEYRGHATTWDEVVFRGAAQSRDFIAFWLSKGAVVAALNANRWDDGDALTALVDSGASVEPARLADEDIPLDSLVAVR